MQTKVGRVEKLTDAEKHRVVAKQIYEILQVAQDTYAADSGVTFRHSGVEIYIAVNGIEHCKFVCTDLEPSTLQDENTADFPDFIQ